MVIKAQLKHAAWLILSLLVVAGLERQWPTMALAVFLVLTLSLGFAHGAMDIFLLRDSQNRFDHKTTAIYAAAAIVLAAMLKPWPGVALMVLILLSVWHFGEQAHHEHAASADAWLLRGIQGGSSVMLPVLLSPNELMPWVGRIAAEDASWVWPVWVGLAGLWSALLLVSLVLIKPWRATSGHTLWLELLALIVLNFLLSPLLAFALFFGLYHSGAHIWRMRQLLQREAKSWHDAFFIATLMASFLAFAVLMWWISNQTFALGNTEVWLRTTVVALAAVTLPHLVLISRHRQRLFA